MLAHYFHTVRHLRPVQLRHQLRNRLLRPWSPQVPPRQPRMRPELQPIPHLSAAPGSVSTELRFRFLNTESGPRADQVDWAARSMSKLWRYNLHYFDYILDATVSDERKAALIDDWIRCNPPGTADAWEPYPVSLRIVNWVKYFSHLGPRIPVPQPWLDSLFAQASWLERRFEYHLLANHLLKNTIALLFAGAFFDGAVPDRWLQRGWLCFREQLHEQFLPDGGHYERSPMYHALSLADCVDVLALVKQPPIAARVPHDPVLQERIGKSLEFLRDVCLPDGEIPLFNDAAFGIAPTPAELLAHGRTVLTSALPREREPCPQECELIEKPASGYFGFRHGLDMLLVDCGFVGPDYQPGHAHCDTLSYELALDGRRVIVDSGVHDYEMSVRRTLSRSTAGHNTVMLDGQEQSEIWGVFRVARRARPVFPLLRREGRGCVFEGAHDGYRRLPGKPLHRRRILYDGGGVIEVLDDIEGRGEHVAESRIRLHPGYTAVINGRYAAVSGRDEGPIARIEFSEGVQARLEQGRYFPQFGIELSCDVLVLRKTGSLPLHLGYRIVKGVRT